MIRKLISIRETRRFRALAAAALVLGLLISLGRFGWYTVVLTHRGEPVPVTRREQELAGLRTLLAGHDVVGYLSSEQSGKKFKSATRWGFSNDLGRVAFFAT